MQMMKRCHKAVASLRAVLADPDSQTYFPEAERKSKSTIRLDHLKWMAKYRTINHYYYVYGFDRKSGYRDDDYLEEKAFCRLRNHYNMSAQFGSRRANYICLLGDKFIFGMYLQALGFPTPKIMAMCDENSLTWLASQKTEPLESIVQQEGLDVFVKDLLGECGEGVFSLKVRDGKMSVNGKPHTIDQLRHKITGKSLIQARVTQHPEMDALNPHSVNCLRIITARKNDEIVPLSALLKAGSSKSPCDNWAAGGIILGIDLETGKLKGDGFYKAAYGRKVTAHPETKVRFAEFKIPYFDACIETVRRVHHYFYGIHSIGWDVAVSPTGPIILEGNERWDTQMQQVHDPQIKRKFLETLPDGDNLR